jgi:putative membrane protein
LPRPFLTDSTKATLLEAVRSVESGSRAECVIVVRPRSAPYPEAALLGALIGVFAALALMLYAPWPFGLAWFLADPALVGLVAGILVHRSHLLTRLLTTSRAREAAVRADSRVAFVERGVTATRERTGLLLYVSLLERRAEVVPDRGILDAVDASAWAEAAGAIEDAVSSGLDGAAVAERLQALGRLLAAALPAGPDGVNELPDEVVMW